MLTKDQTHIAKVEISMDFLRQLLKLPESVKFLAVKQDWTTEFGRKFEVLIESPDLPEVLQYDAIPRAKIILNAEFCAVDEITHIVAGTVEAP